MAKRKYNSPTVEEEQVLSETDTDSENVTEEATEQPVVSETDTEQPTEEAKVEEEQVPSEADTGNENVTEEVPEHLDKPETTVEQPVEEAKVEEEEVKSEEAVAVTEETPGQPETESTTVEVVTKPIKKLEVPSILYKPTELLDIINNKDLTVDEKVKELTSGKVPSNYRMLSAKLESYELAMKQVGDVKRAAGRNYDLLVSLRAALNVADYSVFKMNMDIINFFFRSYSKSAFGQFKLHRFMEQWPNSTEAAEEYSTLVTIICTLAEFSTRAAKIKAINFNGGKFNTSLKGISEKSRNFLLRYYGVA